MYVHYKQPNTFVCNECLEFGILNGDDYTHMHEHFVINTILYCYTIEPSSDTTPSTQQMIVPSSYENESSEPGECVHGKYGFIHVCSTHGDQTCVLSQIAYTANSKVCVSLIIIHACFDTCFYYSH